MCPKGCGEDQQQSKISEGYLDKSMFMTQWENKTPAYKKGDPGWPGTVGEQADFRVGVFSLPLHFQVLP